MFDAAPQTPQNTSWTMHLLARLDQATGPGVMDKPIFDLPKENPPSGTNRTNSSGVDLEELKNGTFDSLFANAPDKPSELFQKSQVTPPLPAVKLVSSLPFSPISPELPRYPPIARVAHFGGSVTVKLDITPTGNVSNISFVDAEHKQMLQGSVAAAAANWKFPEEARGQHIEAVLEFNTNCQNDSAKPH